MSAMENFKMISKNNGLNRVRCETSRRRTKARGNVACLCAVLSVTCSLLTAAGSLLLYLRTLEQLHVLSTRLENVNTHCSQHHYQGGIHGTLQDEKGPSRPGCDDKLNSAPGAAGDSVLPDMPQIIQTKGFPERVPQAGQIKRERKRSVQDGYEDENDGCWAPCSYMGTLVSNHLHSMPKVHLLGLAQNVTNYTDPNNRYILWRPEPSRRLFVRQGIRLRHVNGMYNRVKGIEIQQPGIYLVYSQIIVNGSIGLNSGGRDCAHETVEIRHGNLHPPRILMSGYLTQERQGLVDNNFTKIYPRDSSLQMGIFRLRSQSQIRIRIPLTHDCRLTNFATETHNSYFGLYRIS